MIQPELHGLPHLVEVAIDPGMHNRPPEGDLEGFTWPVLDTTWNMLRDLAARIAIREVRSSAAVQGLDFPENDEELFRRAAESDIPGMPTSYRDLAPDSPEAMIQFMRAFTKLVTVAVADAQEGLR